jgi:pilus assembly protein FimV
VSRSSFVRRIVPWFATALLLCATLPAFALGLGQIVVKSRPGQPLLAEIPIISSDPEELQGLQAQLASPETFARVGLAPPTGLVADLDFSFDQDAAGRPLIRVTTQQPVQQAELVFLLEVDWGSGRLVREYSALVDTPQSVAAPAPEPLQMPTPVPADTVQREPLPETQPAPVAQTPPPSSTPAAEANPTNAVPAAPVPPPPAPVPVAASAPGAVSVQRGDTLGRIAAGLGTGRSLEQTMLALLRANPDAFIDGNVNLVKAGAVLRVPDAAEFDAVDRQQAAAIVQQQVQRWRGLRATRAQPQPAVAEGNARQGGSHGAPASPRIAGARLEIAPPASSDARRAGTRSGIEAGGEGEMLRQELQQTKETLSARDAEVAELKARVAELEKLQKEQQQLLSMKDSALAGAQQDLAKAREARTAQEPAATTQQDNATTWWPWALLPGLAIVAAWWWLRRRRVPAAPLPSRFDSARLAAAVPVPNKPEAKAEAAVPATPAWTRDEPSAAKPAPTPPPAASAKPVWQAPQADTIVPLNTAPAGRERLELARAYIDLGDDATARSLLLEVIDGGDAEARAEAQRLLGGMA